MMRVGRFLVAAALAVAVVPACDGEEREPIRVGVLTNCAALWAPYSEPMLAAAELPLLMRGAKLVRERPSAGIREAAIAGRPVELVVGCSPGTTSGALREARRLVETRGVDVLAGGFPATEAHALRSYAHRRPETTFVIVGNFQATTLQDPARNLFRFYTDAAQWNAGLGSFAYRELGWRKLALVADDIQFGYEQVAGFIAEYCALGGQVVKRVWPPPTTTEFAPFAARVPRDVDGVAALGAFTPVGFLQLYGSEGDLAGRVVVGAGGLVDQPIVEALGRRARGIVSAGPQPADLATPSWNAYVRRARRLFPKLPLVTHAFVVPYYVSMEAVVRTLEAVDGDLSDGQSRFRRALSTVELDAPTGRVRLDENRQAIAPNYLMELRRDSEGRLVQRTIGTIERVEQSFGGRFRVNGEPASRSSPECEPGDPPPWAR